MDNSTHNDILVRYIDGELSGPELEELEQRIASDPALKAEWEGLLMAREAIRSYGLKERVANVHREMMKELKTTPIRTISPARRIIRYSIAVAASILIIVLAVAGYNFYMLSSNKVFADNYHSYELSVMRDSSQSLSELEKAYVDKNYSGVIQQSYNRPYTIKENFLRAMSYLELGNNPRAIEAFKQVIAKNESSGTTLMKDDAEYYLALTYLRNRDFDLALDLLEKIRANPRHLYHEKVSSKLIRRVKMLKWR